MIYINPFEELLTFVPAIALQGFVVVMILLVAIGTLVDMAHKKNAKYFFINFKRAKASATNELSGSQKAKIISKTIASDILTTSSFVGGVSLASFGICLPQGFVVIGETKFFS